LTHSYLVFRVSALFTALLLFLVRRSIPFPYWQQALLLVGLLIAAFCLPHWGYRPSRGSVSHSTLPTSGVSERSLYYSCQCFFWKRAYIGGYQEKGVWRTLLASPGFNVLLVGGLLASLSFGPGLGFLWIVLPLLVLLDSAK
jgi:hypothetical protein